jgi:hypothetical protein
MDSTPLPSPSTWSGSPTWLTYLTAWQIATEANGENPLMVIAGSEITRHDEPGHINALFIQDANALLRPYEPPDPSDAIAYFRAMHEFPAQQAVDTALDQGAFLFWNHPWWGPEAPDYVPVVQPFHRDNAAAGKLHGIEIANGQDYSEEAFQIALDLDLALIGCSDVHELIDWDYQPHTGGHRPVTLVLADDRDPESLRQALFARRTAVWFKNLLLARPPEMSQLLEASLVVTNASYPAEGNLLKLTLTNRSDADFHVESLADYTFTGHPDRFTIPQHSTMDLVLKTRQRLEKVELPLRVLNALVAPGKAATLWLQTGNIAGAPAAEGN